ncbi:MAG: hypothetical protein ABIR32_01665 [Ilumatobacteraceae bacterium]
MSDERPQLVQFPVASVDDVLRCFDATAAETFAWVCRLVDGDIDQAAAVLANVYVAARRAGGRADDPAVSVDVEWLRRAGRDLATEALGAAVVDDRVARPDESREVERWLDDETRRRARSAITTDVSIPIPATGSQPAGRGEPAAAVQWQVSTVSTDSSTQPRRRGLAIALIVAAALITAVVWITGGNSDRDGDRATPSPASTDSTNSSPDAPTTTTPRRPPLVAETAPPTTTIPTEMLNPGYVLDTVPDGVQISNAYQTAAATDDADQQMLGSQLQARLELWAEPDATRTSGRWFAASLTQCYGRFTPPLVSDAALIAVGDRIGIARVATDGVIDVEVSPTGSAYDLTVRGFGFSAPDLALIADSVVASAGPHNCDPESATPLDQLRFSTASSDLRSGLVLSTANDAGWWLAPLSWSVDESSIAYASADTAEVIEVSTMPDSPDASSIFEFMLTHRADVDITPAGRAVEIGETNSIDATATEGTQSYVRWNEGDEVIILSGTAPVDHLLTLVPIVRLATTTEWRIALDTSFAGDQSGTISTPDPSPQYSLVGAALDSAGQTWTLLLSSEPDWLRLSLAGGVSVEQPFGYDPERPATTFTTADAQLFVVALRDPGPATTVRISAAGVEIATIPLKPVRDSGIVAALALVPALPPYSIELLDAAGVVVRTLPS